MKRYYISEQSKRVEAAVHRFHAWLFDDDEWGFDEYLDLYGPLVLLFIFFAITCLIGFAFG